MAGQKYIYIYIYIMMMMFIITYIHTQHTFVFLHASLKQMPVSVGVGFVFVEVTFIYNLQCKTKKKLMPKTHTGKNSTGNASKLMNLGSYSFTSTLVFQTSFRSLCHRTLNANPGNPHLKKPHMSIHPCHPLFTAQRRWYEGMLLLAADYMLL